MIRGSAPPIWENSLKSDKLRAVPSAQSKKEPQRGSFSLRGNPYWRMEIRLQGFLRNLHPNPQPSAGGDIAAQKRTVGDAGPYRKAGLLYISLPHLPIFSLQYLVNLLHFASVS